MLSHMLINFREKYSKHDFYGSLSFVLVKLWFLQASVTYKSIFHLNQQILSIILPSFVLSFLHLSRICFPSSAGKRLIQKLKDENVPAHQIMQISSHKNVKNMNNYSSFNNEESKQNISHNLQPKAGSCYHQLAQTKSL